MFAFFTGPLVMQKDKEGSDTSCEAYHSGVTYTFSIQILCLIPSVICGLYLMAWFSLDIVGSDSTVLECHFFFLKKKKGS